jgi:outer membrane protein assembly factor BamB
MMRPPFKLIILLLAAALFAPGRAHAQPSVFGIGLPGESIRTQHRLLAADKLAAAGQWAEAIDEYLHVVGETGDDLVPLDAAKNHCVQARWLCQARLCVLPADALRLYRERVERETAKRFAEAEAARDPKLLRGLVSEALCSRVGDRALDLLGDLAFERGDFLEAEHWWRMLCRAAWEPPPREANASVGELPEIVFPSPQVDVARVQAKLILAQLFRGDPRNLAQQLTAFAAAYPKASGHFAGRQGNYVTTLRSLVRDASALAAPAAAAEWRTFAASPSRNAVLREAPGRLLWRSPLGLGAWPQPLQAEETGRIEETEARDTLLGWRRPPRPAAHPIILHDQAVVADALSVTAFDLQDGRRSTWYSLATDEENFRPTSLFDLSPRQQHDYTLTSDGDRVYARLGAQRLGPKTKDAAEEQSSFLVCLNANVDGEGKHRRWKIAASSLARKEQRVFFEGAPLVHEGRVYIAFTRFSDAAAMTSLACFDADTGAPRWREPIDLCEVRGLGGTDRRYRHRLLTLAGSNVVYCSHSGALVAVETRTGRRAWAIRYPSRGDRTSEGEPPPRGLCPCLFAEGRLFAAPADRDRVLCLDASNGTLLWQTELPTEAEHLLGLADGKLIFTTRHDIRALGVRTGQPLRAWVQPNDGSSRLASDGSGFVAGGLVFWPTEEGLRVLRLEDGEPSEEWYPFLAATERMGNLAYGEGYLVAVTDREIRVYAEERGEERGARDEGKEKHNEDATSIHR